MDSSLAATAAGAAYARLACARYRSGLPERECGGVPSDAGWGCSLRAAQSLLLLAVGRAAGAARRGDGAALRERALRAVAADAAWPRGAGAASLGALLRASPPACREPGWRGAAAAAHALLTALAALGVPALYAHDGVLAARAVDAALAGAREPPALVVLVPASLGAPRAPGRAAAVVALARLLAAGGAAAGAAGGRPRHCVCLAGAHGADVAAGGAAGGGAPVVFYALDPRVEDSFLGADTPPPPAPCACAPERSALHGGGGGPPCAHERAALAAFAAGLAPSALGARGTLLPGDELEHSVAIALVVRAADELRAPDVARFLTLVVGAAAGEGEGEGAGEGGDAGGPALVPFPSDEEREDGREGAGGGGGGGGGKAA